MSRLITDLIPEMQALYGAFKAAMDAKGIPFMVTCTRRTQAEQDKLYAKGRTDPGPIVTWTRNSKHIEGKAFDIAITVNGKVTWESAPYLVAGPIGESVGLEWGGSWKESKDLPHYQIKEV